MCVRLRRHLSEILKTWRAETVAPLPSGRVLDRRDEAKMEKMTMESVGVQAEIADAVRLGKPVRYVDEYGREVKL